MGDPFDLKEASDFCLITAIVLLVMMRVLLYAEFLVSFLDIAERDEEEFIASNESKKLVHVTMPFTIEFSLNLSIHI
jgi:hypothetical protein